MGTLLVSCVDGRIREELRTLEGGLGISGGDRLQVPGGPLALVTAGPQQAAMTAWIETLARAKDAHTVYLVSHENCLAYQRKLGGFFHDEREVIERDLLAAKRILEDAVYGLRVECYLLPWLDDAHSARYLPAVRLE